MAAVVREDVKTGHSRRRIALPSIAVEAMPLLAQRAPVNVVRNPLSRGMVPAYRQLTIAG